MGCAWADIGLTAPEAGLPLLFIEADDCTEDARVTALKFDQKGDATHPPVLLVVNQVGKRPALKQMERVAGLTREHWQGQWADGFHLYNDKMPIVGTTLELLREHGPAGPAFW